MRYFEFDFKKHNGKIVYTVSIECQEIEQDYFIYLNFEEAKQHFKNLKRGNTDKNYSYTLNKCLVDNDELKIIDTIY